MPLVQISDYHIVEDGVHHNYYPADNGGGASASYEDGAMMVQCNISARTGGIECTIWYGKNRTQYYCEDPARSEWLPPQIIEMLNKGIFTRRFVSTRK